MENFGGLAQSRLGIWSNRVQRERAVAMRNLFDVAWGREGFRPPSHILSVYQLPSTIYRYDITNSTRQCTADITNSNRQCTALYHCQHMLNIIVKQWLFPGININLDRPTVILSEHTFSITAIPHIAVT